MSNYLCCCEFIDSNGERNHILGCCCNCVEVDDCFERLVSRRKIPRQLLKNIMMTAADRLRIPWVFGARKMPLDALFPLILLPVFIFSASQGVWMSVVAFAFLPIFLIYAHFLFMKFYSKTYFFYSWNIISTTFIFLLFELVGVAILEIREDENFAFCSLTVGVFYSIHKVNKLRRMSHVVSENSLFKLENYCEECKLRVPMRSYHCFTCNVCVLQRNQHCPWLQCCIAQYNHKWYMIFLFLNFSQLMLCSNLILTTACHPFKAWGAIMLPDNCSDVYYDSQFALCFVLSLYCMEAAIFVGSVFLLECWLITLGMTGHEYRNRCHRNLCCGLFTPRPYSKGVLRNWINYLKRDKYNAQYLSV